MYAKYLEEKSQVDPAWWDFFADYRPSAQRLADRPPGLVGSGGGPDGGGAGRAPGGEGMGRAHKPADLAAATPVAAASPAKAAYIDEGPDRLTRAEAPGQTTELRGAAARAAANMEASLEVPTATSMRPIPAKVLIENRILINNQLARQHGGRVSFTHLIAFATVEALREMPAMNSAYGQDGEGAPQSIRHAHVKLGLAVDLTKSDGSRQLVVPGVPKAESLDFAQFWTAYEDLIRRARTGKLVLDDLTEVTATLTNPGGIGTAASVPRLMPGQGVIVGVGAMNYPAEFSGASDETIAEFAISRRFTLTSTYDHRVIQGATSGEFLALLEKKLTGEDGFFDRVLASLRVPYQPYRWERDRPGGKEHKAAQVIQLIHNYRVRGHLMADIDPLSYRQRGHRDLELSNYGLSIWDMEREFATGGFGGSAPTMRLRDIIGKLRDAYCRKIGIEYMHIEDPDQRKWIAERVERPRSATSPESQLHILRRLAETEALETFLQTKFVGAKRFSLEGGETLIPALDTLLGAAAEENYPEVGIGMAHRGRLAVLTLIAGKSYRQVFAEFEDFPDRRSVEGSGDVKYHLGTEGVYTSPQGYSTRVHLAANPSHLDAVDGVLLGIVRGKQDLMPPEARHTVLPILIHGDAAIAGQGVIQETLNMAGLQAYNTGGTVHLVINNQIGFTTGTWDSRSTRYATDIAKGYGCPIFHVNGDDPEACVAAARLAFDYRAEFGHDVLVDIVGYRRRGHNEGDDPSMTQPVMYSLIRHKRSVRKLYTESLIARGDLSVEAAEAALRHFQDELERALNETRRYGAEDGASATAPPGVTMVRGLEVPHAQVEDAGLMVGWRTAVPASVLARIGQAHGRAPEGFTVHPKLAKLLSKREAMSLAGGIDWGFAELLSFGSLLLEGTPVRMVGQDSRRGTFAQRHAVLHDVETGDEWTPLGWLARGQAPFWVYDSPLSEYAPAAFEYGYSLERPDALVVWEAQFGDFFNGAQTVLDEFVASAEQKWHQHSAVVFLLPHGYEGQGPDHSSARIERFTQLCAESNLTIAQPTTPAQYFHLLRRQAYSRPRRPLIVFTPKSMLRRSEAVSDVADFTDGTFAEVIGDSTVDKSAVRRVLLCSGKVYWDLVAKRAELGQAQIAIVRLEQLYPLNHEALAAELGGMPADAELVWCQEEPANQGAWQSLAPQLQQLAPNRPIGLVARPPAASPATGSHATHQQEAQTLLKTAFPT
jgi:2-oxoglutarate dehydrogenase E1 component